MPKSISDETYHVHSIPLINKYVKEEDAEHSFKTFQTGQRLSKVGVTIKYLHAPVGMYNGHHLICRTTDADESVAFKSDGSVIYFLFQHLPDGRLRYTELPVEQTGTE